MNLKTRVKKIERENGINETCEVCEAISQFTDRVDELATRFHIVEPNPKPHEVLTDACSWCLRVTKIDISFLGDDGQVAYKRFLAASAEGSLCAPENLTAYDDLIRAINFDREHRFAVCLDKYKRLVHELTAHIELIATRALPRYHYLCRVPDCACEYPKTEAEWQANNNKRPGKKVA